MPETTSSAFFKSLWVVIIDSTYIQDKNQCEDLPITKDMHSDNTLGDRVKDHLLGLWTIVGQMQAKTLFIIWIIYDFLLLTELVRQFGF